MTPSLEIACFDLTSAKIAADAGADRIEFATDYASGGLTPDKRAFEQLRSYTSIPIFVLIRSRPGDFCYDNTALMSMARSITDFKNAGADGFVFGCLDSDLNIDTAANHSLLDAASGSPSTFHRAIDRCNNGMTALQEIIKLGFKTILSSGTKPTALEGAAVLADWKKQVDRKISIMAGGGVRSGNIQQLLEKFPTDWYHTAAITGPEPLANASEIKHILEILKN